MSPFEHAITVAARNAGADQAKVDQTMTDLLKLGLIDKKGMWDVARLTLMVYETHQLIVKIHDAATLPRNQIITN